MMKRAMNAIEAVFERGYLKPLARLPLQEHQHVWVTILTAEPSAIHLAQLAEKSPSFQFLADAAEDRYSPEDGQPV